MPEAEPEVLSYLVAMADDLVEQLEGGGTDESECATQLLEMVVGFFEQLNGVATVSVPRPAEKAEAKARYEQERDLRAAGANAATAANPAAVGLEAEPEVAARRVIPSTCALVAALGLDRLLGERVPPRGARLLLHQDRPPPPHPHPHTRSHPHPDPHRPHAPILEQLGLRAVGGGGGRLFEHIEDADLNDELPLPTKPNRPADQFEHPDESVKPVPTPAVPTAWPRPLVVVLVAGRVDVDVDVNGGPSGLEAATRMHWLDRRRRLSSAACDDVDGALRVPLYRGHMEYLLTVVALGSMEEATTWLLGQIVSAPPDMRSGEPGRG